MKYTASLLLFLLILTSCAISTKGQDGQPGTPGTSASENLVSEKFNQKLTDSLGADQYGMKPYVIVMLKTGEKTIEDKEELNGYFRGHMENIQRLAKEGKLTLAGPFSTKNEREYRGMFIFNVKTKEEAETLVKTDPAVIAGVFDYEIFPWYGSAALPMFLKYHEQISKENP